MKVYFPPNMHDLKAVIYPVAGAMAFMHLTFPLQKVMKRSIPAGEAVSYQLGKRFHGNVF